VILNENNCQILKMGIIFTLDKFENNFDEFDQSYVTPFREMVE